MTVAAERYVEALRSALSTIPWPRGEVPLRLQRTGATLAHALVVAHAGDERAAVEAFRTLWRTDVENQGLLAYLDKELGLTEFDRMEGAIHLALPRGRVQVLTQALRGRGVSRAQVEPAIPSDPALWSQAALLLHDRGALEAVTRGEGPRQVGWGLALRLVAPGTVELVPVATDPAAPDPAISAFVTQLQQHAQELGVARVRVWLAESGISYASLNNNGPSQVLLTDMVLPPELQQLLKDRELTLTLRLSPDDPAWAQLPGVLDPRVLWRQLPPEVTESGSDPRPFAPGPGGRSLDLLSWYVAGVRVVAEDLFTPASIIIVSATGLEEVEGLAPEVAEVAQGAISGFAGGIHTRPIEAVMAHASLDVLDHLAPLQAAGHAQVLLVPVSEFSVVPPDSAILDVYADASIAPEIRRLIPWAQQVIEIPSDDAQRAVARLQEALSAPVGGVRMTVVALDAAVPRGPLPPGHPLVLLFDSATVHGVNRPTLYAFLTYAATLRNLTIDLRRGVLGEVTLDGRRYAIFA